MAFGAARSSTAAGKARERLAITRLDVSGNVPQSLRRGLVERLVEGLTAVSFEVLRTGAVDSSTSEPACHDPDCFKSRAEALGVRYLVEAAVQEQDKIYEIRLQLISGRTGVAVGANRERCEICGVEDVGEKMSLAAASLRARLEALSRAPARMVIRTRPEGSTVRVDGRRVGETPVDLSLDAGEHRMVIEREGFSPLERSFAVTSGIDETLDLDLVRLPTKFPFGPAGWAAIATGTALAIAGVYLIQMDGKEVSCSVADKDDLGHCPRIYRTKVLGAGSLGLAAVSATLGGVWLYLARPASGGLLNNEHASLPTLGIGTYGRF